MRFMSAHIPRKRLGDTSSSSNSSSSEEEETGLLLGPLSSLGDDEEDEGSWEQEHQQPQKQKRDRQSSEHDPHAAGGLGGSLPSAALGIIKGMVGPAILYLPHGFASAGYLVAIPVMLLSAAMFLWTSACLLEAWKRESDRVNNGSIRGKTGDDQKRIVLSYPELARRAFGTRGERLVQVGISLMQSGVCLTYLIFVPQNLRASALLLFDWDVSAGRALAFMVALEVPMSWIRDIRRLTATNLLANILILYGLVTCLGFAVDDIAHNVDGDVDDNEISETMMTTTITSGAFLREAFRRARSLPAFEPSGWFLFLGTSVLLFEGSITLLVPLQEAVQTPDDRRKFPSMYRRVIMGIVSFYLLFGTTCWMAFGNDVRTVMTTSLPPGTMATTVQLAYSLAVVFTFPLQNFPSLEIVSAVVGRMLPPAGNGTGKVGDSFRRNVISSALVVLLSVIALSAMDDLDRVVSLMGSLLGCPLAFVLPPLIQNRLDTGRELGERKRRGNVAVA
eukprot:CAMPEP_0181086462 /NCGR_PEP_ID=MMETSP1071-20121207/5762_1 /TAXON_ID=35127 /ORGANISM="Thalassiosira sp., Strain NH16" /LENGTH=504 /DNA_ID=CAMNT_0023168305 /DNA_START=39 /DNA_END=1550 /DNA_ORIENTATION=+